jgi:predicted nucleic acid-binding protein
VIFIDSNVPMYLVGASHPNKDRAVAVLTQLVRDGEQLITDVEVYQEILHRYTAILRPDAIDAAFESLDAIADDVLTFGMPEVRAARTLIGSVEGISARDALHVAVMRKAGTNRILSFDHGFDNCPGIERLGC